MLAAGSMVGPRLAFMSYFVYLDTSTAFETIYSISAKVLIFSLFCRFLGLFTKRTKKEKTSMLSW